MSIHCPTVITITSGKGGVGKTNLSVNLAAALAAQHRVVLMDADLGLANVDVLLGVSPSLELMHLFQDGAQLSDILCKTPFGFSILPASSGVEGMAELTTGQKLELIEAMDALAEDTDYLLVDTGAGVCDNVLYFAMAAQERIIVVTPEPSSIADAYALIKILKISHGIERFRVCINRACDRKEALSVYARLCEACDAFLAGVSLSLTGFIPQDPAVRSAVIAQQPLVSLYPESPAARAISAMAQAIPGWRTPDANDGNIKFFWQKLLYR